MSDIAVANLELDLPDSVISKRVDGIRVIFPDGTAKKLSEHTYEESIKCAMELIKQGHKKIGMGQHRLRQTMSKDNST